MSRSRKPPFAVTLGYARRVVAARGLAIVVWPYGQKPGDGDVWAIHFRGREVGHWVPATACFRIGDRYGGPAAFREACDELTALIGITTTTRKTA